MKLRFLIISLLFSVISAAASDLERDDGFTHNRAAVSGSLTSVDTWQLDFSYHYMFCKYIGAGGAVGAWKQILHDGYPSGSGWSLDDDDSKISNLYLRPSLVAVSPTLFKICDAAFSIMAEPGMMMCIPYESVTIDIIHDLITTDYRNVSSNRGQWLSLDCRAGLCVNVYRCNFIIGYEISNLDIFSRRRHMSYDGISFDRFYDRSNGFQGAFASLTYNF